VASKDFGEMIYEREGVPEVTAHELDLWMSEGRDILLLDSRTPEEHSAATIPSSRSMPGGELALRIHGLERGPSTTVVVHCAGRTRSIVGARTLIRMGIENVYALRNGTMGWRMAGLDLEVGSHRTELPEPADADRELAGARARALAEAEGVAFVDVDGLREIESTTSQENVYLIDVRTREEFEGGHVPGFRWFPGGQLLQRTDEAIGVREASAVLACDGLARAAMTAAWLAQMGFPHVRVLDGGTQAWTADGGELETGLEMSWPTIIRQALDWARAVEADDLRVEMAGSEPPILLSVGTSHEFARGHLPGSTWAPRGSLELRIGGIASSLARPLVVTSLDEAQAALSARALIAMGYESVRVLAGGIATWRAAGGGVERGLSGVMSPPQDILPAGTERSWAEMMQYLTWEEALGHKYHDG
jgi:rhodanese-related sulfurtransferase